MYKVSQILPHETLDPDDWDSFRKLGHRMVDDMLDYLESIRERPAWQRAPEEIKRFFIADLPRESQTAEDIYEEFLEYVLPYPIGNIHPRFWGWVFGTGTVLGAMAEFLAAVMNTNAGDMDHHSANHVEKQVLTWIKEMLGYPVSASGLLTSGCSAANLIALIVARNAKAGYDLRSEGIKSGAKQMVLYASEEIHSSIQKAIEIIGLGNQALRRIPVDHDFQMNIPDLVAAVHKDRESGKEPFCVIGAAGTTNTAAFDDLGRLADFCSEEDLWFHVDGAFGAWAALTSSKNAVVGMERADSLAIDLHKWMYLQYDIGCVLVRNAALHRDAFFLRPAYLERAASEKGMTSGDLPWLTDYGFQLSRNFQALKAWMSIKEHGSRKIGRLIEQNINQAKFLADQIRDSKQLELMAPVSLNVVCFRYFSPEFSEGRMDKLNQEIMAELQESGIAVVSGTRIKGRFALHVAVTNHRSAFSDFEILVGEVVKLGEQISKDLMKDRHNE